MLDIFIVTYIMGLMASNHARHNLRKVREGVCKMLTESVTFNSFCDAFVRYGRNDNFSYMGKWALFEYFEEFEENVELDIIAICCEYSENEWEYIAANYLIDLSECETDEERIEAVREYLSENTMLIGDFSGTFVYADF